MLDLVSRSERIVIGNIEVRSCNIMHFGTLQLNKEYIKNKEHTALLLMETHFPEC